MRPQAFNVNNLKVTVVSDEKAKGNTDCCMSYNKGILRL